MTVKRMDNVGIVVEDIDAAIEFFTELGLELEGRAPIRVSTPVTSQTTSSQPGAPTCRAMIEETMKMPEPIIEPATIIVESSRPKPRMKPVRLSSTPSATSVASAIVLRVLLCCVGVPSDL